MWHQAQHIKPEKGGRGGHSEWWCLTSQAMVMHNRTLLPWSWTCLLIEISEQQNLMSHNQLAIRITTTTASYLWPQSSFLCQNYSLVDAVCSQIHQHLKLKKKRTKLKFKAIFDSFEVICHYITAVNKGWQSKEKPSHYAFYTIWCCYSMEVTWKYHNNIVFSFNLIQCSRDQLFQTSVKSKVPFTYQMSLHLNWRQMRGHLVSQAS